jgi:7,8-dihydroneopterin aldolase/epimerase/oxygenase
MNSDTIIIKNLAVTTHIGVPDDERAHPQQLLISVTMHTHTRATGKDDDISKSIDYAQVVEDIQQLAATERKTLEKFAEDISSCILKNYTTSSVSVEVRKFILPETDYVGVSITRP